MYMYINISHILPYKIGIDVGKYTKSYGFYGFVTLQPWILKGPLTESPPLRPVVPAPQASPATVRCSGFSCFQWLIWCFHETCFFKNPRSFETWIFFSGRISQKKNRGRRNRGTPKKKNCETRPFNRLYMEARNGQLQEVITV